MGYHGSVGTTFPDAPPPGLLQTCLSRSSTSFGTVDGELVTIRCLASRPDMPIYVPAAGSDVWWPSTRPVSGGNQDLRAVHRSRADRENASIETCQLIISAISVAVDRLVVEPRKCLDALPAPASLVT